MIELAERVASLAAASAERDRGRAVDIRARFPEFAAWADAVRRDLPGPWQAWSVKAEGVDMRGGKFEPGTWVTVSPKTEFEVVHPPKGRK